MPVLTLLHKNLGLFNIDNLINKISGYVEKKIELVKLEIQEDMAVIAAKVVLMVIMGLLLLIFFLFLSLLLGIYINNVTNSKFVGFGIVAIIYFVIFLLLVFLKKPLKLEKRLEKYLVRFFN